MHVIRSLLVAFATYSRIPVPRVAWTDENRRYALCFFPLVGAAVGAALTAWLLACDALGFSSLLRGAVGAAIPLLVTGGIHMDGFMDTCDALASWQTRERRLEILKDSHVGAFAVMACCGYMLVMAGLLGEAAAKDAPAIAACFVLSRALSAVSSVLMRGARPEGMLSGLTRASQGRAVAASGALYALVCAAVWALRGWRLAALCLAFAAVCLLGYRRMAYRHFGGVTGDLAGWLLQVTELCLIAAVVIGGRLL